MKIRVHLKILGTVVPFLLLFSDVCYSNNCETLLRSFFSDSKAYQKKTVEFKVNVKLRNFENPPNSIPYIALGFYGEQKSNGTLYEWAQMMDFLLQHPVYVINDYVWPFLNPIEEYINKSLNFCNRCKAILFRLDNFNVERAFSNGKPSTINATSAEAYLILSNPRYFDATRWFENNKELSKSELKIKFQNYFPKLFN